MIRASLLVPIVVAVHLPGAAQAQDVAPPQAQAARPEPEAAPPSKPEEAPAAAAPVPLETGVAPNPWTRDISSATGGPLRDWMDPSIRATSVLLEQCGHVIEADLRGEGPRNFLLVVTTNNSRTSAVLDGNSVLVRFGDGGPRRLEILEATGTPTPEGWRTAQLFVFPDKGSFRGQQRLTVSLPFASQNETCVATARFVRPSGVPESHRTSTTYGALELNVGAGPRFLASGNQKTLGGDAGTLLQLGLGGYFGPHHGVFLDLSGGSYGDHAEAQLVAPGMTFDGQPRLDDFALTPTYAFRFYLAPWLAVSYLAGIGLYTVSLKEHHQGGDSRSIESVTTAAFRERLRVLPVIRVGPGLGISIGGSLVHVLTLDASLGEASVGGNALGWMVELGLDGG